MYLHIGKDFILKSKNVIGIFDIESIQNTSEYNNLIDKLKINIFNLEENSKKTFILTEEKGNIKGYISNISSATIGKRINVK